MLCPNHFDTCIKRTAEDGWNVAKGSGFNGRGVCASTMARPVVRQSVPVELYASPGPPSGIRGERPLRTNLDTMRRRLEAVATVVLAAAVAALAIVALLCVTLTRDRDFSQQLQSSESASRKP